MYIDFRKAHISCHIYFRLRSLYFRILRGIAEMVILESLSHFKRREFIFTKRVAVRADNTSPRRVTAEKENNFSKIFSKSCNTYNLSFTRFVPPEITPAR